MVALPVTLPELKVVEQSGMKNRRLPGFLAAVTQSRTAATSSPART